LTVIGGDFMYNTDKLKEARKQANLTIYDMANSLGVTAANYSQIENKKRKLSYSTAVKLASVFNLKPDDLFYINK